MAGRAHGLNRGEPPIPSAFTPPLDRARVWIDGRAVAVRPQAGRLTALVDLRTRPRGRTKVDIAVRLRGGKPLTGTRFYRTCTAKPGRSPRPPRL